MIVYYPLSQHFPVKRTPLEVLQYFMPLLVQRHSPGCILDPLLPLFAMINLPPHGNILIWVGGMYALPIQPYRVRQLDILPRRQD
ncbi:hypothetical protein ES707_11101 [subsurface metagenome]